MDKNYKPNTLAPSGNYEIIYGETNEYGMGGPYASCIYLKLKDKAPFFVADMCYGDLQFAADESCFYFLHLNVDRKIQVMQFDLTNYSLKLFYDEFEHAEFETVNTKYGYSINGKNWVPKENRYNEGLIICDTNAEHVQTETIVNPVIRIQPRFGIDIVGFYDTRKTVNQRLKNAESFSDRKIDFFTEHGFHIHYNENDVVEFIEIMGDMQSTFELYGKNPFATDTKLLIDELTEKNNGAINLIDAPEDYMFLDLSLGVFRNSTPEKFVKYIEQTKLENPDDFVNGIPEWLLQDLEKTKYFQIIGLGNKDYFRNPIYFQK
jgi:hypothetical protein